MHDHHFFGPDLAATLANIPIFWAQIYPHEFGRYFIAAGLVFLLVNVWLSRPLAGRKIRSSKPSRAQMVREFLTSARTAAIFGLSGVFTIAGIESGLIDVYAPAGARGWPYFAFTIIALIVLHDAWFYWTHRLIHDPRLFRRFHRTHHKSHNPSPWAAYSFDMGEAALNALYAPLALSLIPTSDLAMVIFLLHMIIRNAIGHSGYEIFPSTRDGRPLLPFLTSVTHHDLHHAQAGWNYGLYFTWWDKLMGTEHPLYAEKFAAAVRKPLDGSAVRALGQGKTVAAILLLGLAAVLPLAPNGAAHALSSEESARAFDAIKGVWATEGHGAHVKLAPCENAPDSLCGSIVWSWDPNIMAGMQGAALLGGFKFEDGAFSGGWLKNPEDGATYRGQIRLDGESVLRLKGCALVFCKTQVWRRLGSIPGCDARNGDAARRTED